MQLVPRNRGAHCLAREVARFGRSRYRWERRASKAATNFIKPKPAFLRSRKFGETRPPAGERERESGKRVNVTTSDAKKAEPRALINVGFRQKGEEPLLGI